MRYSRARLDALAYELPPVVVASAELEERLAPVYRRLGLQEGQLEQMTGIRERRWWDAGFRLSEGAARAGRKALLAARVRPSEVGLLIYAGVCREGFEPATACAVAEALGVGGSAAVYDLSNACLGVLNGILEAANRIELGQTRAALIVSCESAREINELTIARMLEEGGFSGFKDSLATLTGGSGAVAALLTDGSIGARGHRLLGGCTRSRPSTIAYVVGVWRRPRSGSRRRVRPPRRATRREFMRNRRGRRAQARRSVLTPVLEAFLKELSWTPEQVDKTICHQVGLRISARYRGVPACLGEGLHHLRDRQHGHGLLLTATVACERGFLSPGERVAFLGIGSGLNTLMLGFDW